MAEETIQIGATYRLRPWYGGRGPSDDVVVVTRIVPMSKTANTVWFIALHGDRERPANLSDFRRRVWAREPTAIQ